MLRSVGDPADGTPFSAAAFDRLVTEFRVELVDGRLDYLPMPRDRHAAIVQYLNRALDRYLLAEVPGAALRGQHVRVRIRPGRSREPDLVVLLDGNDPRRGPEEWAGADLCVEVVSPDDPDRDYAEKRADYAEAGVREYWIVDPRPRTTDDPRGRSIRVLTLDGGPGSGTYREAVFEDGDTATGPLLAGFAVDVTAGLAGA